jgi:hypothetical protein
MVKFIRTGEGLLVVAFNVALLVVPIVSSALTPAQAVKWAAVINGVTVVARTGLKMTSLVQSGTGAAPDAAGTDGLISDDDEFASVPSGANGNDNMTHMGGQAQIDHLVSDGDELTSMPPTATAVPMTGDPGPPAVLANGNGDGHNTLIG